MRRKIFEWYKSQAGYKKWLLQFMLNWLYWGLAYGIIELLVIENEERSTIRSFLLKTTFMALFWTLVFDSWISPSLKKKFGIRKQSDPNHKKSSP